MKRLIFVFIATTFLLASCEKKPINIKVLKALAGIDHEKEGFPDFGYMVSPAVYIDSFSEHPLFRLKADFPEIKPTVKASFIGDIDFKKEPLKYLEAARDYAFEGNLPTWDPYKNKKRDWYHIPWLHPSAIGEHAYPPNGGTEGFHGLIKEAAIDTLQLGPNLYGTEGDYSVYAITLINDMAGYSMGRMWKDPNDPDLTVLDNRFKDGGFPVGTVFAKLLFTDAPKGIDRVDYLENPLTWTAYITENFWISDKRVVSEVNLLQMDISIRDARADRSETNPEGTGWVFGTFCYNGQLNKENKFMNLVPIGVMWGNDPENKENKTSAFPPTETVVNKDLVETVIFESDDLPPQHLGWNGRLNGPADLNTVSCMSCHITAQYPQATALVPPTSVPGGLPTPPEGGGSDEWMIWFQNIEAGHSMNEQAYSMDFSFQVAIALENFFNVKYAHLNGSYAEDYAVQTFPISRGEIRKNRK
ncbi:MAG: hypothetical protein ACJATI_004520 [Halioglobus sp.]|jgi:hypothetical protein